MKKATFIFITTFTLLLIFPHCQKENNDSVDGNVQTYKNSVSDVNVKLVDFIEKAQEFESTDVTTLPIDEVKPFMDSYILSGEQFVESLNTIIEVQEAKKTSKLKSVGDGPSCSPYDFIPGLDNGLSPALAKSVGDLIKETKGEVDEIQLKWKTGEIDDNTYYAAMNALKVEKPIKGVAIGFGAIMGTGAAIVVGAATAPLSLSALATTAVVTGTGAVVGATCTWLANWYASEKDGEQVYHLLTGTTNPGEALPINLFGENTNLIISPEGYAPVAIDNFTLPESGMSKKIEIEGVELGEADWNGSTQVCFYEEQLQSVSCSEVQLVTAGPNPPDPAPSQGVTVIATLIPTAENCDISFSIVGTDGYSNSATYASDANGNASFYIPGGAEGVVDVVTITSSNGKTYTVTYVF